MAERKLGPIPTKPGFYWVRLHRLNSIDEWEVEEIFKPSNFFKIDGLAYGREDDPHAIDYPNLEWGPRCIPPTDDND